MGLVQIINYDTAGNFAFDATKIEFSGALVRLLDQLLVGTTFEANYSTNINGTRGDGVLTGTATGGASVSGGKLALDQSDLRYVDYAALDNADSQQTATIKFKVTPDYSGTPVGHRTLFVISKAAADNINLIFLRHDDTGQLHLVIKNSADVNIMTVLLGLWVPVAGVEVEFELNMDITVGATRLFLNGLQFGATQVATGTRSADIGLLRIGSNALAADNSDFKIDDFVYYSGVQHTANYTPGYTVSATQFPVDNPTVLQNSGFQADALLGFIETTSSKAGADEIKYVICVDGVDKYWDGAAWATSDGTYAQANLATVIETNKAALDISTGATLKIKAFLHSDTGATRPTLTTVTVTYDFFVSAAASPNECVVFGEEIDNEGDAIVGMTVRAILKAGFFHNSTHYVAASVTEATTNAAGFWEMSLVETATDSEAYDFEKAYTFQGAARIDKFDGVEVPNAISASLDSIA